MAKKQINEINKDIDKILKKQGAVDKAVEKLDGVKEFNPLIMIVYMITNTITDAKNVFLDAHEINAKKYFNAVANQDKLYDAKFFKLDKIGIFDAKLGKLTSHNDKFVMQGYYEKQIGRELENLINALVDKRLNEKKENK